MRHDTTPVTEAFAADAKAAQARENAYRAEAAAEIDRLERERVFAFRRARLVGMLADVAARAETVEAAVTAQKLAVADEFGWNPEREDHATVLAALAAPGRAVWSVLNVAGGASPAAVGPELAAFEDWYRAHAGQSFYVLFDQYVPQAPLVDF